MDFLYTIDPNANEPIILIDRHIGTNKEDGPGIMADQLIKEISFFETQKKAAIQFWMNSSGGQITEAEKMIFAVRKCSIPTKGYNMGTLASIAVPVYLAMTEKWAMDYSKFMFHPVSGGKRETREEEEAYEAFESSVATMICTECRLTEKEVREIMARTTWMTAKEAEKHGIVDKGRIETSEGLESTRKIAETQGFKAAYKDFSTFFNKQKTPPPMAIDISKFANKLNLHEECSEKAFGLELDKLIARADTAELANKATKDELAKMKNDLDEAENKFKDMKDKYDKMVNDAATADMENRIKRADLMLNRAVELGKITNDAAVIKTWRDKFVADEKGTEALLKTMGVNASAPNADELENNGGTNVSAAAKKALEIEKLTGFKVGSAEYMNYCKILEMRG